MTDRSDLEPFNETLDDVFKKLGLPDPVLMSKIVSDWEELAGSPWVGRSKPLYVRGRTLVVAAQSPSMVAFLRYGESSLVENLKNRYGTREIEGVEVVPPGRG